MAGGEWWFGGGWLANLLKWFTCCVCVCVLWLLWRMEFWGHGVRIYDEWDLSIYFVSFEVFTAMTMKKVPPPIFSGFRRRVYSLNTHTRCLKRENDFLQIYIFVLLTAFYICGWLIVNGFLSSQSAPSSIKKSWFFLIHLVSLLFPVELAVSQKSAARSLFWSFCWIEK